MLVVGNAAGSKWMSDDLLKRAASKDKHMHIVEGSNHGKHYDVPKYVDEAVSVLAPFFREHLMSAGSMHSVAAE
jgi:uncharacterized protein